MKEIMALLLVLLMSTTVHANDTLRCGNKIVKTGMSMDEVKKYCGTPSSTEVEEHDVRSGNRVVGKTQMNIWRYNRSSQQKTAILEFDQQKLMSIKYEKK
jgi:hypothetical protein